MRMKYIVLKVLLGQKISSSNAQNDNRWFGHSTYISHNVLGFLNSMGFREKNILPYVWLWNIIPATTLLKYNWI